MMPANSNGNNAIVGECNYYRERMSYATAEARCDAIGATVCPDAGSAQRVNNFCNWKPYYIRQWRQARCTIRIQVDNSGWIRIVHHPYGSTPNRWGGGRPSFAENNENPFRVAWEDGDYPLCGG